MIVTGIGRSGHHSMIAGILSMLKIPMGDSDSGVFEDRKLRTAIEFFLHLDRISIVKENNKAYDKWGFKFPSLPLHLRSPELEQFREPRLIVIYRDLIATAKRAAITDPKLTDEIEALNNVTQQQVELFNFVKNAQYPTILISYEKFIITRKNYF